MLVFKKEEKRSSKKITLEKKIFFYQFLSRFIYIYTKLADIMKGTEILIHRHIYLAHKQQNIS